ncbi:hypothetical protein ABZ588_08405 [Streptomyces althioticus]|uniref:hypothetical protein n=1 Tax=Streptomyces althioticus TaxID=83380 RepID=UPI003410EDA7
MTHQTEPIRKSSLPATPPPEWEFFTFFPYPDDEGGDMVRGQRQRGVQVRRLVTYGDWEPVRPDRWADEPEPAAVSAAVAPPTNHTALSDREKAMLSFALEIAQEEIHARSLDITDQDGDALVSLRRMADETATETPAPDDRRPHACTQFGTWFDRSVCAEPCGAMHTRCTNCGVALDACPHQPAAGARQDGDQS